MSSNHSLKSFYKISSDHLSLEDMTLLSRINPLLVIFHQDYSGDEIEMITCGNKRFMRVTVNGSLDEGFNPFSYYYRNMFTVTNAKGCKTILTMRSNNCRSDVFSLDDLVHAQSICYESTNIFNHKRTYRFTKITHEWYHGVITKRSSCGGCIEEEKNIDVVMTDEGSINVIRDLNLVPNSNTTCCIRGEGPLALLDQCKSSLSDRYKRAIELVSTYYK